MSEIDSLLHALENIYDLHQNREQVAEDINPQQQLKNNVNEQICNIEEYIKQKCKLSATSIGIIKNGFTITKTYEFKESFGKVLDMNEQIIDIGDTVEITTTYYGKTQGKVINVDCVESLVYVDINGDVFYKPSSESKLIEKASG